MSIPGVSKFNGKVRLAMSDSEPNIVMASIGRSNGKILTNSPTGTWLAKTTDNGDTWTVVPKEDYSSIQGWYAHDVAIHPVDPNVVWAAGQPFWPVFSSTGGTALEYVVELGLFNADPQTNVCHRS